MVEACSMRERDENLIQHFVEFVVFWVFVPCSVVSWLQPWRWRQHGPSKRWCPTITQYSATDGHELYLPCSENLISRTYYFCRKFLKGRDHSVDLGTYGKIILEWFLGK